MTAESQLTTTNAVIMKEKLFINTESSSVPCEGNYKFSCNHSHVKLCPVMLAYRLLMQQQYDWVQKLPTENRELLTKKRKMSAWRDWAFFLMGISPKMEIPPNLICKTTLFLTKSSAGSFKLSAQKKNQSRKPRWTYIESSLKEYQLWMNKSTISKNWSTEIKTSIFYSSQDPDIHCLICQSL